MSMQAEHTPTTVMIVDDTVANLRLLSTLVGTQGYRVVQFPRGALALRAAVHNPPDLILLDIMMPDMDGFQVCQRLKAHPALADIPVIFISATSDVEHKVRAFTEGGVDYVTKPFQEAEVLARVKTHLKLRQTQQALEQHQRYLEQRVQEQVQQLHTALQAAQAGTWKRHLHDDSLYLDAHYTRLLGYAPEKIETITKDQWLDLVHPDDQLRVMNALCQPVRRTTDHYEIEYRIRHQDGHWIWLRSIGQVMPSESNASPHVMAGIDLDITEQKNHQAQLDYMVRHDALTGLPNRVAFTEYLHTAITHSQQTLEPLAVAYIDLDDLIALNQTYGREIGDQLIIALGHRLRDSVRIRHSIARIGWDEFVALLSGPNESVPTRVHRLLESVSQPITLGADTLMVTASIGVTRYPQGRNVDADQLLRQADQAMYQAKLAGKNRYHIFDPEQDQNTRERYVKIEAIRHALTRREFILYYQPKINMRSGQLLGFEALIRWQHPEQGLVPPGAFIPFIEQHPLSIAIGDWVIEAALQQLADWQSTEFGDSISVSVNVSTLQLHDPDFAARLQHQLRQQPSVRPEQLELEVLETGAIEDMNRASAIITRLRQMGVHCALDDFGTGYSSLTFLKQLPATTLKIDQSFVRQMLVDTEHLVIIHSILGLAQSFDRYVVAEGVETEAHGRLLLELGCELGQGYGIARPMPAAAVPEWLEQWQVPASWRTSITLNAEQVPALIAELDHQNWYQTLSGYLSGQTPVPPPLDQEFCRFSRWLNAAESRRVLGQYPGFADLEKQHTALHHQAQTLVHTYQTDPHAMIGTQQAGLDALCSTFLHQLRDLRQSL
jgi:diguanylate cyclase (GGDEF)-like protein/PAS domain S-box-containing protein